MADYTELIRALRTMRMQREDIENSLKVLSHIVDDEFIKTVDEARKIIGIDGEIIESLQAEVEELKRVNMELFDDLPKYGDKILHLVSVEDEPPEPNIQCLVRDDDNNYAVGYYRQDARAWDSPFFGWLERDDEYYKDGDLCRIGKVVAWMSIEPSKEVQDGSH